GSTRKGPAARRQTKLFHRTLLGVVAKVPGNLLRRSLGGQPEREMLVPLPDVHQNAKIQCRHGAPSKGSSVPLRQRLWSQTACREFENGINLPKRPCAVKSQSGNRFDQRLRSTKTKQSRRVGVIACRHTFCGREISSDRDCESCRQCHAGWEHLPSRASYRAAVLSARARLLCRRPRPDLGRDCS